MTGGIGAAFGSGSSADHARDELFRASYPVNRDGPRLALVSGKSADWVEPANG